MGVLAVYGSGQACTLWAAVGGKVAGGGTLIAKNRDFEPTYRQIVKIREEAGAYRFLGVYEDGNEKSGLKMGINEHGLVIVSANPPFSYQQRQKIPRTVGLSRKILSACDSVDSALSYQQWFVGPCFLLLADRQKIALVEIGLDGNVSIQQTQNGVLYHSNHYIDATLEKFNPQKISRSSLERYKRIDHFMTRQATYTLEDFISISGSREGGPDNSIWRDGSKPSGTRTLAAWIVRQPAAGQPQLYLRLANPGEKPETSVLNGVKIFSKEKQKVSSP